ncbi:MAG: hypothetical protein ACR2MA_08200 [Egibacteraceae bacterium]
MKALQETLDRLVGDGVLTAQQAEAVSAGAKAERSRRRISPLVEVGGYLGGALAGVSAIAVLERFWDQLTSGGQVGLLALAAAALWAAGRWVVGDTEPAVRRLVGVLWLLSTATATAAAGVAAAELADLSDERVALVASLVAVVHAGWLWRVTRGALQQIALFVGAMALGVSGLAQFEAPPEEWFGLLVWALALSWALLTWGGLVAPARTGYVLGGLGMIAGAETLHVSTQEHVGLALGLVTALALFAAAAALQQLVTAGLGIVATTIFLPQALIRWFGDTVDAPLIVFFVGVVILAGALFAVRVARADEEVTSRA